MNVISDAEFDRAAELAPGDLLRYLRGRGWAPSRDYGRGQMWVLRAPDDPEPPYEVMVPLDRRPRDYADRVADVLATLSLVEDRRPGEVLREMTLPSADWQYLRLMPPGPSGTAPLADLMAALAGLKDLLTAAAASAHTPEPQAVQPAQKPRRVKAYVDSVRLDQTRVGSYVIAAHTPLPAPPPQVQLSFGPPTEPFERLVSRRLFAAVWCARDAAERTVQEDSLVDFAPYAEAGVSANLCEALVRIAGEERRTYELSFDWSGELPVEQPTPPVSVRERILPALEAAAKDLRTRLGQKGVYVHGTVVRLDRSLTSGPGEVTVLGHVDGEEHLRARRYRMTLQEREYSDANFAHDRGHEVTVRGDVVIRGPHARLERVSGFTVRHVYD